jgi:hypothetical protein
MKEKKKGLFMENVVPGKGKISTSEKYGVEIISP